MQYSTNMNPGYNQFMTGMGGMPGMGIQPPMGGMPFGGMPFSTNIGGMGGGFGATGGMGMGMGMNVLSTVPAGGSSGLLTTNNNYAAGPGP